MATIGGGILLLFFLFLNLIFLAEKPLFHNFVICPTTDFYQKTIFERNIFG
jgi:hypothetical protein